jgi:hypothetical protein
LQQCCFSLEAISGWLPEIAQKKVLLLSEKPVIHDAGLMDVGVHQSAGILCEDDFFLTLLNGL